MDFLSFVQQARTCRRFVQEKALHTEDLDWLVSCARLTPSARNAQVVRFIEVTGEACEKVFPLTHWAMALKDWKGPAEGERPTAFLALLLPEKADALASVDLGIVAQTIQLAAHSRDLGCCIIKSFELGKMTELLPVPEGYVISLVLGLGVAAEKRVVSDVPEDGSLSYWRDEAGTHYVPKRSLSDLIVARVSK
ncbi:MAG: nitroreductase family protein [Desulfovibrionaceae bacterium]|nr:nitroreductase family protein [Desulfovibrionaceae bacterium]